MILWLWSHSCLLSTTPHALTMSHKHQWGSAGLWGLLCDFRCLWKSARRGPSLLFTACSTWCWHTQWEQWDPSGAAILASLRYSQPCRMWLVAAGCARLSVCKEGWPLLLQLFLKCSVSVVTNPSYNIRNTKVQVVLTCPTPDIRFLGKDPEESGNCGTWWIISGLAWLLYAAYFCRSLLFLTAGRLWKCNLSLTAFTISALLIGWRKSECDTYEWWSYVLR